jgi:hypothetical protein
MSSTLFSFRLVVSLDQVQLSHLLNEYEMTNVPSGLPVGQSPEPILLIVAFFRDLLAAGVFWRKF